MSLKAEELDAEPASQVRVAAPLQTLSMRLWDLDWSRHLPWTFDDEISVAHGTFADAIPFITEHYANIFPIDPGRFLVEGMTESKRRFWEEMDLFIFRSSTEIVGIAAGHPTDWSTYYVRTIALLSTFRGKGLGGRFYSSIGEVLRRAGVARWEVECTPANIATIRIFLREGLVVTGNVNSERWGTLLRFTKFLRDDVKEAFERQFLSGSAPAEERRPR